MKRYSTAELRKLEIVNLCDGARLGYAEDFEFEAEGDCSRILSLIISGSCGFLGEDTILVKLTPQEFSSCLCGRKSGGRRLFGKHKC